MLACPSEATAAHQKNTRFGSQSLLYLKVRVGAQGEVIAIAPDGHETQEVQGGALGHNVFHCDHSLLWWKAMFTYNKHLTCRL